MGVHCLWKILHDAKSQDDLNLLKNRTLAIDLSIWICEDLSIQRNSAANIKLYIRNLFFRLVQLLTHNISVVFVLDGMAPLLKAGEMRKRQNVLQHGDNNKKTNVSVVQTKCNPAKLLKRSQFRRIASQCCQLLDILGIPYVQSPGEAESMCALLNRNGLVDAVQTCDSDTLLYGAHRVYTQLNLFGRKTASNTSNIADVHSDNKLTSGDLLEDKISSQIETVDIQNDKAVKADVYNMSDIEGRLGLDRERLVALALLLGCDYNGKGVPGIGVKLAMEWLRALPASLSVLNLFRSWSIPAIAENRLELGNDPKLISLTRNIQKCVAKMTEFFPNEEIINEYLSSNMNWSCPKKSFFAWSRPHPEAFVNFCSKNFEWEEKYSISKLLPLMIHWDIQFSFMSTLSLPSLTLSSQHKTNCALSHMLLGNNNSFFLIPMHIVKQRKINFVACYEVAWKRMDFDKWTDIELEFYLNSVPCDIFTLVYPTLVADFDHNKSVKNKLYKNTKHKKDKTTTKNPSTYSIMTDLMNNFSQSCSINTFQDCNINTNDKKGADMILQHKDLNDKTKHCNTISTQRQRVWSSSEESNLSADEDLTKKHFKLSENISLELINRNQHDIIKLAAVGEENRHKNLCKNKRSVSVGRLSSLILSCDLSSELPLRNDSCGLLDAFKFPMTSSATRCMFATPSYRINEINCVGNSLHDLKDDLELSVIKSKKDKNGVYNICKHDDFMNMQTPPSLLDRLRAKK